MTEIFYIIYLTPISLYYDDDDYDHYNNKKMLWRLFRLSFHFDIFLWYINFGLVGVGINPGKFLVTWGIGEAVKGSRNCGFCFFLFCNLFLFLYIFGELIGFVKSMIWLVLSLFSALKSRRRSLCHCVENIWCKASSFKNEATSHFFW